MSDAEDILPLQMQGEEFVIWDETVAIT